MSAIWAGDITTTASVQNFDELKGRNFVLYFYPKDFTPGCTRESREFRDLYSQFNAANTVILGISGDSLLSHENFKTEECLPFDLIADPNREICEAFEVILDGKIKRSTFVFNSNGELVKEYRGVSVPGHVEEVLEFVKSL